MGSLSNDIDRYAANMLNGFDNKQHLEDVKDYLFIRERIDKVNKYTRRNDVQSLLTLDKFLRKKPFKDATQDDLLKWEEYLEKILKLSPSTIEQYEAHVKRFYRYLSDIDEYKKGKRFQKNIPYPNTVSWISSGNGSQKDLPLDKILNEDQLLQLLEVCEHPRDKALIAAAFYDAGLRIGEAISLNVGNVDFDNLSGYFILPKKGTDLKTGMRKIRLFLMPSSTKYLRDFVNNHPLKKYPDAPLFYSRDSRVYYSVLKKVKDNTARISDLEKLRLSRPGIEQSLELLCKYAGLEKITPHTLRHNSCTQAAKKGFNEMELRIRYGWSKTSKMPSRYTHLASRDLDDKIKVLTGFKEPEKPEESKLITVVCWNCNEENVPTNKFCGKCGMNLNPTKEEMTTPATETGIAIQKVLSDPKLQDAIGEILLKKIKELQRNQDKP